MKKILAMTLSVAMLLVLLFPVTLAGAGSSSPGLYDEVLEKDGFIYGVNLPWITPEDEGATWAANTVTGKASGFNAEALEAILRDMRAVGFNGIRISLLEQMQGLAFGADGSLTGVSEEMLANLTTLLDLSDEIGIQIAFVVSPDIGEIAGELEREKYDYLSQILTDSSVREIYLEKVLKPIGERMANYPDVVLAVDVLSDPDSNIYDKTTEFGTTWDVLRGFISAAADQIRAVLPDVPVMASSAAENQASVRAGMLNKLGLDILGVTDYNDTGDATPAKDLHVSTPVWLTEMGTLDPAVSDDVHTATTLKFYQTARDGGYRAAFYGCYGDKSVTDGVTLIDAAGRLRLAALSLHFTILDNAYERAGQEEYDAPVLMNITSASSLRWIGTRYAASYTIERSTDGEKWTAVASHVDVSAVDPGLNNLCSFSDDGAEVNQFYYYRVTANMDDGSKVVSDVSPALFVPKLVCSEEENLLAFDTGFETGTLGSEWQYNESDAEFWKSGMHQGSVEDGTTHSGSWSYKLAAAGAWNQMYIVLPAETLTAGTKYTFTMYYKVEEKFKNSGTPWIGLMRVNTDPWGWRHPATDVENEYMTMNADGEWHAYTYTFTATSDEYIYVIRNAHYGEIYLDDLYLFEAPEVPSAPGTLYGKSSGSRSLANTSAGLLSLSGDNLFTDGGFETGHVSNDQYEAAAALTDEQNIVSAATAPENVRSGNYALAFSSMGYWSNRVTYRVAELKPNTYYQYSYWYKVTDYTLVGLDAGPTFGIAQSSSLWDTFYSMPNWNSTADNWGWPAYETDGEWHQAYGTFYTGDQTKFVFTLWDDGNTWTAYIDDLYLAESDTLFLDGGFETGHVSNDQYEAAASHTDEQNIVSAASAPENVHSGRYALTFSSTGNWSDRVTYRVAELKPNTYYQYSYWYKVTDYTHVGLDAGPTFGIAQSSSLWDTFYSMPDWNSTADNWGWPAYETDGEWHQAYGTFYTGDQTKFVFALWDDGNTWTAYIDDLYLAESNNLFADGGFETGHVSSEQYEAAASHTDEQNIVSAASAPENVHSGRYALTFSSTGNWSDRVTYRVAELKPNTYYQYSYWYKVTDYTHVGLDAGPTFGIAQSSSLWDTFYSMPDWNSTADNWGWPAYETDGEWHQAYGTFYTGDQTKFVFALWDDGNTWTAYIDDLYLAESNNLFADGGFETGHVSSEQYEAAASHTDEQNIVSAASAPENVHSGRYALTFSSTGSWSDRMLYRVADLKPNTTYTYSYWYKVENYKLVGLDAGPTFGLANTNSLWDTFYSVPNWNSTADNWGWPEYTMDGEWHQAYGTFNTGDRTKFVFTLWDDGNTWTAYIDDLYLAESAVAVVPEPDAFVVTATVSQFVTDKLDVASADKNLLVEDQRTAALTAEQSSWSLEVAVEPETEYVFSAWVKGDVLSDTESGSGRFGVANPYNGKFLMTDPVYDEDKLVTAAFLSGMSTPCWDGEWHQRGLVFNSGNLESIVLTMSGANSGMELRNIVLCKAEDAVAAAEETVAAPITQTTETPGNLFGCAAADNLFNGADMAKGAGYNTAAVAESVDGVSGLKQDGSGLGATYILWTEVQPHTDYTFSVYAKGMAEGNNVFGLLTDQKTHLQTVGEEFTPAYDQKWDVYTYRFNSGDHTQIAFFAYDGGGELLFKNLALFETSKAVEVTDPVNPPIENPETGVSAPLSAALTAAVAGTALAVISVRRRKSR